MDSLVYENMKLKDQVKSLQAKLRSDQQATQPPQPPQQLHPRQPLPSLAQVEILEREKLETKIVELERELERTRKKNDQLVNTLSRKEDDEEYSQELRFTTIKATEIIDSTLKEMGHIRTTQRSNVMDNLLLGVNTLASITTSNHTSIHQKTKKMNKRMAKLITRTQKRIDGTELTDLKSQTQDQLMSHLNTLYERITLLLKEKTDSHKVLQEYCRELQHLLMCTQQNQAPSKVKVEQVPCPVKVNPSSSLFLFISPPFSISPLFFSSLSLLSPLFLFPLHY